MHALASSDQNDGANGQLLRIEGAQVDMIYAPPICGCPIRRRRPKRARNAGFDASVDATEASKRNALRSSRDLLESVREEPQVASVFSTAVANGTGNLAKMTAHRRANARRRT